MTANSGCDRSHGSHLNVLWPSLIVPVCVYVKDAGK